MALAKRNVGANVNSDINVTPMVDVMLVLLIIFMVITPMLQKGISVDMAKVNNPTPMQDADKEDALLVSVMRDGTVYFGADKVTADSLGGKVKDRLTNRTNKMVYVKADARAHYGGTGGRCGALGRGGRSGLADRAEERKPEGTEYAGHACARTVVRNLGIEENDHEYGSWPERRPKRKYQRHPAH
jgi:biopolymer transport protein TolR